MPVSIPQWLEQLGLGQYAKVFAGQEILPQDLPELSDADLRELGIPLGPRKRLLKAIAALGQEAPGPPLAATAAADSGDGAGAWERHPGERKPVTLLFADITESTALTENRDAEETHDLLYGATQRMCAAVERNRGTVCRFMGDGMMAMFGAPRASEQHALDACQAALDMQQAVRAYAAEIEQRYGSALKIRIGMHSGEVVVLTVGEGKHLEYDASGPTVPIAARMEQAAIPGRIFLTAATRALAAGRIEAEPLEAIRVKGISEPLPVFLLEAIKAPQEAVSAAQRTHFVGRRSELLQLRGMLTACIDEAEGRTVCVRGEPGIGKTRLVEELAVTAVEKGFSYHRGLILPFGLGKGQDAIHALVRSFLGIAPGSGKPIRRAALDQALAEGRIEEDQAVFLHDLLNLPQPTALRGLYDAMDTATRNTGKQAVVETLLETASRSRPVLAVVEDAHWADTESLAHLAALSRCAAECPALLVVTSRIEGDPLDAQWRSVTGGCPFFTIDLGPLKKRDAEGLIAEFIDTGDPLASSCLERSEGNPLFLEQLLHAAREGSGASLPDSIQSLILARLDRLEAGDKAALQAAAVIGQRFDAAVVDHLLGAGGGCDCAELVRHNLIRPDGDGYLFAHALIQEGIYASLLKAQRQALHQKAAEWFAGRDTVLHAEHLAGAADPRAPGAFFGAAREQSRQYRFDQALELTGRGRTQAVEAADKFRLLCLEGELLRDLARNQDSIDAYRKALEAAADDGQRCDAWLGIAAGLRVMTDYPAALALLDQAEPAALAGERTDVLTQLHHLRGNLYFSLGRAGDCREEHLRALEYARECGSSEAQALALGGLGDAEYARGRMLTAGRHYSGCIDLSRAHGHGRIEVAHLAQRSHTLVYAGRFVESREEGEAAVEVATRVSNHRAELNACIALCENCFELSERRPLEHYAQRSLELCRLLGARAWGSTAHTWLAVLAHLEGRAGDAWEHILEAVGINEDLGQAFDAGRAFGVQAWISRADEARRETALTAGEAALGVGVISHNYFYFYRFAMESLFDVGDWDRIEAYATALEDHTRDEPLPWTDFFIARARALVAVGKGARDPATLRELKRLSEAAEQTGFMTALTAIENARA